MPQNYVLPQRHFRRAGTALAAVLLGTAITTSLTSSPAMAGPRPAASGSTQALAASATPASGSVPARGGKHGGGVTLPADWPTTVPVPAGTLTAVSGVTPRWSILLVVNGSAPAVQKSTLAFYKANGWKRTNDFAMHKGRYTIGFVAANRDHSATRSNLTIALSAG